MGRYLSWAANSLLFVLCCYLVADTANEVVFAALLTPRAENSVGGGAPPAPVRREWSDRDVILKRNLFNASMLEPVAPIADLVMEEQLEETKLPLTLLGTAAADSPEYSWAAVADGSTKKTVVVGINHAVNAAIVKRIERRRIVLSEKGVLRELVLDEDAPRILTPETRAARAPRDTPRTRRRAAARERAKQRQEQRTKSRNTRKSARQAVEEAAKNPADLLAQGRILPKYEDNAMVGLQVNRVEPGSVLEEIGIREGDVITQLNGVAIDPGQDPSEMLSTLDPDDPVSLGVKRADGPNETLTFAPEQ